MTTPSVPTFSRGGMRYYRNPLTNDVVPGVTSIIGLLPKPWLGPWSAKMVAQAAIDDFGALAGFVGSGDHDKAVKWLKGAPYRKRDGAADAGTDVHAIAEARFRGESVKVHPDLAGYVRGLDEFIERYDPQPVFVEATVWNGKLGYAGSFDLLADIGDERVLIDVKTTASGVHAEVALQLAAYDRAPIVIDEKGDESAMPDADAYAVLWLRPDEWKLVPVSRDPVFFDTFVHLLEGVHPYEREHKDVAIGRPLDGNVFDTESEAA